MNPEMFIPGHRLLYYWTSRDLIDIDLLISPTNIRIERRVLYFFNSDKFSIPLEDIDLYADEGDVIISWVKQRRLWKSQSISHGDACYSQFAANCTLLSWIEPINAFRALGFYPPPPL